MKYCNDFCSKISNPLAICPVCKAWEEKRRFEFIYLGGFLFNVVRKGIRIVKSFWKQYWKIIAKSIVWIAIIMLLALALWILPIWQTQEISKNTIDAFKAENEARKTLAQIVGGIVVLLGIIFTWRRVTAAEKTVEVAHQGQITERFTRAIDQLGSEKLEVRLGGIYALERIARNSSDDLLTIIDVLTAYIRSYTLMREDVRNNEEEVRRIYEAAEDHALPYLPPGLNPVMRPPTDIVASVNSIGKKLWPLIQDDTSKLDISGAYLARLNLSNLNLQNALFAQVSLAQGSLHNSCLRHCDFTLSDFIGTVFTNCNFQKSCFTRTYLIETKFSSCCLKDCVIGLPPATRNLVFINCDLRGATFASIDLSDVNFFGNDLRGTNFKSVTELNMCGLLKINFISRETIFPANTETIDESLFYSRDKKISCELLKDKIDKYYLELGIPNDLQRNVLPSWGKGDMERKNSNRRYSFCQFCVDD